MAVKLLRMTITRAQVALAAAFVVSLLIQVGLIFYSQYKGAIYPDEQTTIISKLLGVYAVHLAVIIGGIFSQQVDKLQRVPVAAFWFAMALAVIWNLLLTSRTVSFTFSKVDDINDYISFLTTISSASSFLVMAAIAFFFTKR